MIIAAIIQARCGSTRFPNKVFADICGKPLLEHIVNRLRFSETVNKIVIATTTNPLDDKLYNWAIEKGILVFRGNEENVLNRYNEASNHVNADVIVRITADDPFKDPVVIDKAVSKLIEEDLDFVCNNFPPSYPEGLDVEVFTKKALEKAEKESKDSFEKEHVTQYFYRNPLLFRIANIANEEDLSYLRWTIDTEDDLLMAQKVYASLYSEGGMFYMNDILNFIKLHPEISSINANVARSEMYKTK